MAKRSHLSKIGITKKEQGEIAGCLTWLLPFILLAMLFF